MTARGYDTATPANTPLTGFPSVTVGGSSFSVVSSDFNAGTFTLNGGVSADTTATFSYHVQDVWTGTDSTLRRAKVTSTSDPAGEWVTIGEVASVTDSSSNATSRLFRGEIALTADAAKQGTSNDGVWVQDSDTLTANYYNSAGAIIDSDTVSGRPSATSPRPMGRSRTCRTQPSAST